MFNQTRRLLNSNIWTIPRCNDWLCYGFHSNTPGKMASRIGLPALSPLSRLIDPTRSEMLFLYSNLLSKLRHVCILMLMFKFKVHLCFAITKLNKNYNSKSYWAFWDWNWRELIMNFTLNPKVNLVIYNILLFRHIKYFEDFILFVFVYQSIINRQ